MKEPKHTLVQVPGLLMGAHSAILASAAVLKDHGFIEEARLVLRAAEAPRSALMCVEDSIVLMMKAELS